MNTRGSPATVAMRARARTSSRRPGPAHAHRRRRRFRPSPRRRGERERANCRVLERSAQQHEARAAHRGAWPLEVCRGWPPSSKKFAEDADLARTRTSHQLEHVALGDRGDGGWPPPVPRSPPSCCGRVAGAVGELVTQDDLEGCRCQASGSGMLKQGADRSRRQAHLGDQRVRRTTLPAPGERLHIRGVSGPLDRVELDPGRLKLSCIVAAPDETARRSSHGPVAG